MSRLLCMHGLYEGQRGRAVIETGEQDPGKASMPSKGCTRATGLGWLSQDIIGESHL